MLLSGKVIDSLSAYGNGAYLNVEIVPFLEVRELERREAIVKAFNETDDFNAYMEDA